MKSTRHIAAVVGQFTDPLPDYRPFAHQVKL